MSGIKVSKKAMAQFEEMKKKRTHKFLILAVVKEKVEVTDAKSGDAKLKPSFADFTKAVIDADSKKPQPKWGVVDYEAKKPDGSILSKLVLVNWCPDNCKIRQKMLQGSTNGTVKSKLGIDKQVQAQTPADLEENVFRELLGLPKL
uniref:Actin depolymerizing factor n=1 Tax=Gymnochlora stellata TaxID=67809 RepID=B5A4L1_GYMST|nr:actin depolymerizing factor [Gymnochlora stellata]